MYDMKAVIGYGLIVLGLAHTIGLLVGFPAAFVAHRLARPGRLYKAFAIVDLFNGFGCLAAGVVIFRVLGLQTSLAIPIVSIIRSAVYFVPKEQFLMCICHVIGIVAGWLAYTHFFVTSALNQRPMGSVHDENPFNHLGGTPGIA